MISIQREEIFKTLLEKLFEFGSCYTNLMNFLEDNNYSSDIAMDFAEELSKYEESIEDIFNIEVIEINKDTLNFSVNGALFNNINKAIKTINKLNPDDFEKLCAVYLCFLGATKYNITQHSHDQGIDFVGIIKSEKVAKLYSKNTNTSQIYLIGQAKHYENIKVETKEIRELAGSLYLLKNRNFALLQEPYKSLEIKAFTPIYAYFITSYYFSQQAIQLCRSADIIPVDRILLAFTFGLDCQYHDNLQIFQEDLLFKRLNEVKQIS